MAASNEKLTEVNDNLQKIHLNADLKSKELSDLETRGTKLANDIVQLQESIKERRSIGRKLDNNMLAEERKTYKLETESNDLGNIEEIKNRHTENLNKIFKEIQMKQKQRREEYQKLMATMIDRARINPTTYKSIEMVKSNVEQIKTEYLSVEEQLKEVQNELKILKEKFSDPDLDNEIENIETFIDNSYIAECNPKPLNALFAEIKQLSADSKKCEKYIQQLESNQKLN